VSGLWWHRESLLLDHLGRKIASRWPHDDSKVTLMAARLSQDRPKTAPCRPQMASIWPQNGPQMVQRWSKDSQKMAQRWPKDGPRWPQEGQDGNNTVQAGLKLALIWSQDGPKML
jgi:hypothetical protein